VPFWAVKEQFIFIFIFKFCPMLEPGPGEFIFCKMFYDDVFEMLLLDFFLNMIKY